MPDFNTLVPTPNYTPPNVDLSAKISALPNALWEGLQQAQTQRERNLFRDGVPVLKDKLGNPIYDPNGNPQTGFSAAQRMALQVQGAGGLASAPALAGLDLQRQQLQAQQQGRQRFYGPQSQGPDPSIPPSSSDPVRVTQPPPQGPTPPMGPPSGPQGDQSRSLIGVVSQHYPPELAGRMALIIGQRLGVSDPNVTLNPEQYAAAMDLSQSSAAARNIPPQTPQVPPSTNPSARPGPGTGVQPPPVQGPQMQPPPAATPQQPPMAGPQGIPPQAGPMVSGQAAPQMQAPPPASFDERFNTAGAPPPTQAPQAGPYLNDLVPQHYRGREGQLITDLHDQATMMGTSPADSKAYLDWADAIQKRVADFTKEYPGIRAGEDPIAYKARLARDTEAGKASATKQADTWSELDKEGQTAREHLQLIGRLRGLGADTFTGAWPQVVKMLGDVGIPIDPRLPQVQAMQSVVNQLIPTLRVPNMRVTNFDVSLFKDALPRMINDPKGNALIMDTLTSVARYKIAVGELASRALNGEISPQLFRERIGTLANPFEAFRSSAFADTRNLPPSAPQGQPQPSPQGLQRFSSPDELSAAIKAGRLKKGDQFISGDGKTRAVP